MSKTQKPSLPVKEKFVLIKNTASGLVLDATGKVVMAQQPTGFPQQIWILEHIEHGKFFIINKTKEFVLDIQKGGKKVTNLVICEKQADNVNQQWYINSDGTIVNANEDGLAVDIGKGNEVIAYQKNGNENQKFHFQDV
ncbi:hypothetical protein MTP99_000049 [Tenebrio molitor]|jgi:hypothetical protein|nr:hypothetical protein MTP99_000049 [Tenebrio molitor]